MLRAAVLLAFTSVSLAACEPAPDAATSSASSFWALTVEQDGVASKSLVICADDRVLEAFERSLPEVDGTPCRLEGPQLVLMEVCTSGGEPYAVHSRMAGVGGDDFRIATSIASAADARRRFERRLHFHRLARQCPAPWEIGETGVVGERQVLNVVSGRVRMLDGELTAF